MEREENWSLYDGYCNIYDGEINYCQPNGKKEKVTKYQVSSIISIEKEINYDPVHVQFNIAGKVKKKKFDFKKNGDGEKFINTLLDSSSEGKFDDITEDIGVYKAIKTPLFIFLYTAALILGFIAVAYGIVYGAQIMDVNTVRIPVVLLIPMEILRVFGINKFFVFAGIIGLICLASALVRIMKRPKARVIKVK